MDSKFFMASKTIWGVILMVAPTISAFVGYDWSAQDSADLDTAAATFGMVAEKVVEGVGVVLTIWGRIKASGALKLMPGA